MIILMGCLSPRCIKTEAKLTARPAPGNDKIKLKAKKKMGNDTISGTISKVWRKTLDDETIRSPSNSLRGRHEGIPYLPKVLVTQL